MALKIKPGDSPAPGITVLDTPGHTPGHISLHIEAQFYEADWYVAFDIDPAVARATREVMYPRLNQTNQVDFGAFSLP